MEDYERECCVRGYHVYKEIWAAALGEQLVCEREPYNPSDRYAVAVVNSYRAPTKNYFTHCCTVSEERRNHTLYSHWKEKTLCGSTTRRPRDSMFSKVQR